MNSMKSINYCKIFSVPKIFTRGPHSKYRVIRLFILDTCYFSKFMSVINLYTNVSYVFYLMVFIQNVKKIFECMISR